MTMSVITSMRRENECAWQDFQEHQQIYIKKFSIYLYNLYVIILQRSKLTTFIICVVATLYWKTNYLLS